MVIDAETANGDGADRSVDRRRIKAGENFGKGFLWFEVFMAEDEPGWLRRINRIEGSVVAGSDVIVRTPVVDWNEIATFRVRILAEASFVHVEIANDGDDLWRCHRPNTFL